MRQNNDAVMGYIERIFAAEDALLKQVRSVGEELRAGMQVGAVEGQLLRVLVQMVNAKRVVEVGGFVGYSAICMARALPADGELITMEYDAKHAAILREHAARSGLPITVMEGDALELIPTIEGEVDVIFIDAEKRRYVDYLDGLLPRLRRGGLVIGDNTLLFGAMAAGAPVGHVSAEAFAAMRAFNQRLADATQFTGVLIPTEEGLSVAVKI